MKRWDETENEEGVEEVKDFQNEGRAKRQDEVMDEVEEQIGGHCCCCCRRKRAWRLVGIPKGVRVSVSTLAKRVAFPEAEGPFRVEGFAWATWGFETWERWTREEACRQRNPEGRARQRGSAMWRRKQKVEDGQEVDQQREPHRIEKESEEEGGQEAVAATLEENPPQLQPLV